LIELLVSITILGILSVVVLGGFRSSQIRARDAKRKSDLKQIGNSLEMFFSDKGVYPASNGGKIVACPYSTSDPPSSSECEWGSGEFGEFKDDNGVIYFKKLPADSGGFSYYYVASPSANAYQLYAHLENPKDQDCVNSNCSVAARSGINCGGVCNFAVTSPNIAPTDTP